MLEQTIFSTAFLSNQSSVYIHIQQYYTSLWETCILITWLFDENLQTSYSYTYTHGIGDKVNGNPHPLPKVPTRDLNLGKKMTNQPLLVTPTKNVYLWLTEQLLFIHTTAKSSN